MAKQSKCRKRKLSQSPSDLDSSTDVSKSLISAVEKGDLKLVRKLISSFGLSYSSEWSGGYFLLRDAIMSNKHREVIKLLLTSGSEVNLKHDDYNDTPLHYAVLNDDIEIVEMLLDRSADINVYGMFYETPLYIAIRKEYEQIVKILLEHGANVNVENQSMFGKSMLHVAVENGCSAIIENILEYNPSINSEYTRNSELLHTAVEKGYFKVVEVLLKCGIDVNMFDSLFLPPLHIATKYKHEEVVALLINYGANVNAKDKYEKTPVLYAIQNSDVKITKLLLDNATDIVPQLLNAAVENESKEILELLIQYGANINASDEYGKTALHCTAFWGNENVKAEIAEVLLKSGANVDALNKMGETALHVAIEQGYVKVVEILLEYNANVNLSSDNFTPLYTSIFAPNEAITTMLLKKGANVNAKQKDGTTAMHIAVQRNYKTTVELLLNYGVTVDAKFIGNKTAIHLAAEGDNVKISELLLKYGADIDSRDKRGRTALHLASKRGNRRMVVALLKSGADVNILNKTQHTPIEYFKKDPKRSEFIEIGKIFKVHFIKMKSANLYLHTSNLEIVENIDSSKIRGDCKKELESMKNEKIGNISFHEILTKNINQMTHYAKNEDIIQTFKSDEYKTKFPIYASMISNHFKKAVVRMELLEEIRTLLALPLPYICTEKIFSYLSDEDLRDFFPPETRLDSVFENLDSDCDSSSYSIGDYDFDSDSDFDYDYESDYDYQSDSEPEPLYVYPYNYVLEYKSPR